MQKPFKYTTGASFIWVVATDDEKFCSTCDEFVNPLIEVEAFAAEGEELTEKNAEYDDTIGKAFCPLCESEAMYVDPQDAYEAARYDYESDRADAIRKGEW